MVKRVTKDLLDKSVLVDDDKFPISDSEDLFNPSDPESGQLKRIGWWALKDLFINNTVTFVVTSDFASGEIIDITNWTWNITGTTTRTIWDTGDITSIGSSASIFNANASLKITDNKTVALKDTDVIWDSATTFHFTRELGVWEWFIIEDGTTSWGGTIWDTTVEGTLDVTWETNLKDATADGNLTVTGNTTIDGCLIQTGSNFVRVTSIDCLPAESGWIIALAANTQYRLEADLDIGTTRFTVQDGTVFHWLGINSVKLTYTWTDYLFTWGSVSFSTTQIVLDTPNGKVYNLSWVTPLWVSNHREVRVNNCVELGTFNNIRAVQFFNSSIENITWTKWLIVSGTALIFSISELFMNSTVTGVDFIDIWTSIISNLEFNNLIFVSGGASATWITWTTNSANIVSGSIATVEKSNFSWNITPLVNITEKDVRWDFQGNSANVANTIAYGEMYIPTTETVTIASAGVIYPVNDANTWGTNIWTEIETSKFSVDQSLGRITHIWEKSTFFSCTITATIEKVWGWADVLDGYIILNGTPLAHSKSQTENTQPTSITCQAWFTMSENDYVEFWVANEDSNANIIVNISNLTIR